MIRIRRRGALVLLGLAGCAGAGPPPEQEADHRAAAAETIEQILTTPVAADTYAKPASCLSTFDYDEIEVLDDQHVLVNGTGRRMWVNKLKTRCVGLSRESRLAIPLRGPKLCNMDTFQATTGMGMGSPTGTPCVLGQFLPVTPEQAKAIEAALREARRK